MAKHYREINATTKLLYKNNFMKQKCLRVMQGDYNIYIRCNQKCMLCKDRGIDFTDFSVWYWLSVEYAWYTRPLRISTFSLDTIGLPLLLYGPLDGKGSLSKASTAVENQTFGAGVTKNILPTHNSILI